MANFAYTAINPKGQTIKGNIEADNADAAAALIKKDGSSVVEINQQAAINANISMGSLFKKKVKVRDLSLFCRQFVSLQRAGVTIIEAMKMLTEQTENPALQEALQEVSVDIQKGENLANAMRKRPDVFPDLLCHMVAAGEASGNLDIAFERMAVQFEQSAKINGMIKKAMVYPIMVLIVAFVVVIVMLTYIVPTFMEMFADMEIDMPALTLAVVAASDFMQEYWYIVVGIVLVLVIGGKYFISTPTGRGLVDKAAIKIPLFGNLTTKSSSAKFARNLSTMLGAGIGMPEAVAIVADTMGNMYYTECMANARNDVMQGIPLSQPLEKSGLFPPMVYHMTKIGEETGNIEVMLDTLADYYEEEVEQATQSLMAALEPIIIIVLAGICGVIIGAVMLPMASMYEGLDSL